VVLSSSVSDYYFTLNWGNLGSEYFRVRRELNRVLNQLCYTIYIVYTICPCLVYKCPSVPQFSSSLCCLLSSWLRWLMTPVIPEVNLHKKTYSKTYFFIDWTLLYFLSQKLSSKLVWPGIRYILVTLHNTMQYHRPHLNAYLSNWPWT